MNGNNPFPTEAVITASELNRKIDHIRSRCFAAESTFFMAIAAVEVIASFTGSGDAVARLRK